MPGFKSGSFVYRKYAQAKERRHVLMPLFSKQAIKRIEPLVWENVGRSILLKKISNQGYR